MNQLTLARLAVLIAAVQLSPSAMAIRCEIPGIPGGVPCPPPGPPPPPPPPPPEPEPPRLSQYIGPASAILTKGNDALWQSPDAPDRPDPVSVTQVEFRADVPTRAPGTSLLLALNEGRSWASMTSSIAVNFNLGGQTLRLTSKELASGTPALFVAGAATTLTNGIVGADAGDVRIGSGNSSGTLVLDAGAQLLMGGANLRSVSVGTGGAGHDGLLRLQAGAVLRTDQVFLGSSIAPAQGRLELSGVGTLLDISQLKVGGTANGANGSVLVDQGATLRTQGFTVSNHLRTTGEVTVDGSGSSLTLRGGTVNIGVLDNGNVTIRAGGALLGEDATVINLGNGQLNQFSTLRVEGAGSQMSNVGIQVLPSGTLEVRDGARWDGAQIGGVNALAVQGGTARFSRAQVTLFDATVEGIPNRSGLWDISNGSTVTVSSEVKVDTGGQLLIHDTGTSFSGFTTLVLNGQLSVFNGAELRGGLIGLGPDGQLGGNLGNIHADVQGKDGRITPGQSPGRLEIFGNVDLSGLASLELEIAGHEAGISYDVLQVSGNLTMTGGRVVLKFLDGFAPKAGDVFDLLQVGGTLALDGTPVEVQGLQAGWTFDLQQQGDGPDPGPRFLHLVSLNDAVSAVPEPATWLLWMLGALAMTARLGQRRRQRCGDGAALDPCAGLASA